MDYTITLPSSEDSIRQDAVRIMLLDMDVAHAFLVKKLCSSEATSNSCHIEILGDTSCAMFWKTIDVVQFDKCHPTLNIGSVEGDYPRVVAIMCIYLNFD